MSTEHQKYSTENQADVIAQYAETRGFEIVRTYADAGKSGLKLDGRDALKRLIADVTAGRADFSVILVYDVSRWGRFQDADQSAYYEYVCKEGGVTVQYCAEQFENDGSLSATIIKSMKRAMAGEYSRELSAKVFAGQCRLIKLGFRQGGAAGFGLRRQLVDEHRGPKAVLARGEHKSLQTDRVVLVPGPDEEVEVVRRIYRLFVLDRRSEAEIALALNDKGVKTDLGRPWSRATIHQVLTNEKYAGHNVFNRVSFKLKQRRVRNTPDMHVRCDDAFAPVVDRDLFDAAQQVIMARSRRYSDGEMIDLLATLLGEKGRLSALVIDEVEGMPSSTAYRSRFGGLTRAYRLVGYDPGRDFAYIETNRALRVMHAGVVGETLAAVERFGATAEIDRATDLITINNEFTLSIVIARSARMRSGALRWKIRLDAGLRPDLTVALRMDETNEKPCDYYVLPWIDVGAAAQLRLSEDNGVFLDSYRFDSLEQFFRMTERTNVAVAA
jgi:DNA invertase Pin-like site-specific DNA recombinase